MARGSVRGYRFASDQVVVVQEWKGCADVAKTREPLLSVDGSGKLDRRIVHILSGERAKVIELPVSA